MRLATVRVDRYGPLAGVEHEFDGGLEVCYGPNESGKTLLLDAILRLCSPDAVDVVPDVGRVEEPPVGHAVVETDTGTGGEAAGTSGDGSEHVLGDGTALEDVTDVTARQLRNVFVVRDADLRLGEEHEFYDATARRLADLHTAELAALRERVVDAGRLTPTTLNLSRAGEHGNAREVRDDAAGLAERIREYVAECRASGIEAAERERVEVAADLERTRRERDRQRAAETLATHERLAGQLDTVREATETLADRDCTEDGLDRLESLAADLERIADELADCEDRREALREERQALEARRAEVEADLAPVADRRSAVQDVERALERYREDATAVIDGSAVRLATGVAVAAALGAGGSALAGVVPVAVGLAALAAVAGGWALRRHRAIRAAGDRRRDVLAAARDAGLEVETIGDVGPAIRGYRDEHAALEDRLDSVEADLELAEHRLEDVADDRDASIERRRECRRERREVLREAGVPDADAYREAVAAAESLATERREAIASLAERLGDRADAPMAERIAYWEGELDDLRATVADGEIPASDVTAEAFDPDELDRLEGEVERLADRRATLRERLEAHESAIGRFVDDLGGLPTGRFRDEPIALDARSVDGLAAAARELESLVEALEHDADVSRVALGALEDVRAEEEAKLAELFGHESTATATFRSITGGRYDGVTYDPDARTLVVEAADGQALTPRELSRGATDQLYLAARIGLAERLLQGEPGFLLLDDPLLPADPERLDAGFDALQSLADDGWQVIYWTAKPEVGVELVDRYDVPCRQFDRIDRR